MGTISDKLTYLNGTKQAIAESINNLGGSITSETTFREYAEELDTIYSNLPKVTGENTEVTLTPTLKGKLGIVEKGNSTQESTNGYQLLDTSKMEEVTNIVANSWYDLEGNTLSNPSYITSNTLTYEIQNGQTYTFKIYDWNNTGDLQILKVSNGSFSLIKGFTNVGSETFTADTTTNIYIRIRTIASQTKTSVKCMLEKGSTAHNWEQYTNGPAPNPSYPFPIKSVTGNNNVVVKGANMFNRTTATEDTLLTWATGIPQAETNSISTDFIEVEEGATYSTNFNAQVILFDSNKTWLRSYNGLNAYYTSFTISGDNSAKYVRLGYRTSGNGNINMNEQNIMINKGTLKAYEPYVTPQTLPLNLASKNLLDTSSVKPVLNDGGASRSGFYCKIQKTGTYYVLFDTLNTSNILYCGKSTDLTQNTTAISKNSSANPSFTYSFTAGEYFIIWGANNNDVNDKIMITLSDTAIPYEPYWKIELNKIGNYQDYIYKDNDKWYKKEEIGKVVLNGSETYQHSGTRFNYELDMPVGIYESLSNQFVTTTNWNSHTLTNNTLCVARVVESWAKGRISINTTNFSSVEELKTWLSTHNLIVYYQLATPQDIEITDTTLIEQLEEINKMKSYNGTTIITSTFDSNNAQMILSASALKGE